MLLDFDYLVSQLYVQQCTFVEVGEGVCSLFVELPLSSGSSCKKKVTRQMFFGNCQCSEFRSWQLCSRQLARQRPDDCIFEEGIDCPSSSARVHHRLCDITGMSQWNPQCNCSATLAGMPLEPMCGFRTCFASPMPTSLCTPRNVCGTSRCDISLHGALYGIKCDPKCKGRQAFCERVGPPTSEPRVVTSQWTEWQPVTCGDKANFEQSQAECLDTESKPAFDCIGPGLLCCETQEVDCICEVKYEDGRLKVYRYSIIFDHREDPVHTSLKVRSVRMKGQAKIWSRFLDLASKDDDSYSLFSNKIQKENKIKQGISPEEVKIYKLQPSRDRVNLEEIGYNNISQLLYDQPPQIQETDSSSELLSTVPVITNLQEAVIDSQSNLDEQQNFINISDEVKNKEETVDENVNTQNNNNLNISQPQKVNLKKSNEPLSSENLIVSKNSSPIGVMQNTETLHNIKQFESSYHFTVSPDNKSLTKSSNTSTGKGYKSNGTSDFLDENYLRNVDYKDDEQTGAGDKKDSTGYEEIKGTNNAEENDVDKNKLTPHENFKTSKEQNPSFQKEAQITPDGDIFDNNTKIEGKNELDSQLINIYETNTLNDEKNNMQTEKDTGLKLTNDHIKDSNNTLNFASLHNNTRFESVLNNYSTVINVTDDKLLNSTVTNVTDDKLLKVQGHLRLNVTDTIESTLQKHSVKNMGITSGNSTQITNNTKIANNESKLEKQNEVLINLNKTHHNTNVDKNSQIKIPDEIQMPTNTNKSEFLKANITNKKEEDSNKLIKFPTTPVYISDISHFFPTAAENTTQKLIKQLNASIMKVEQKSNLLNNKTKAPLTQQGSIKNPSKAKDMVSYQRDALRTTSNLNPTGITEEGSSKPKTPFYDEPEPVLKDLDKDPVDDNMADVLNTMIGKKNSNKLTWKEGKVETHRSVKDLKQNINHDKGHGSSFNKRFLKGDKQKQINL